MLVLLLLAAAGFADAAAVPVPRRVRISGRVFVLAATGEGIVLQGPNVVVKGPPYLPSTNGTSVCNDVVDDTCIAAGNCSSCTSFTVGDARNLRTRGWNAIRLGVVWAGAQPRDEDSLDPDFLARLHSLLSLCDAEGINVVLDNHGDMVGGAGCGNGVPAWVSNAAAPDLIGKPLTTGFPYNLVPELEVTQMGGYCTDASAWAAFAGDPNYNLLNPCCSAINGGNPPALGFTEISQKTMDWLIEDGPGRTAFVRYWRLLAEAVASHPSAFAVELMNEPMTIRRELAFDTWRAAGLAINAVIPDMSISVMDISEGVVLPDWVTRIGLGGFDISTVAMQWIKTSGTVYYAWHWYGQPSSATEAVVYAEALGESWGVPTFATEFMDCSAWKAAAAKNVSHTYWHYSAYCTTGPAFGNRAVPESSFGACILGWAAGTSTYNCS
jgi:hypothetical protein